jgi:hypothetical protein
MIFNKSNSNIKLFDLEPELEELSRRHSLFYIH